MHGLPPDSFPGTRAAWLTLIHPDDRDRVEQSLFAPFETRTPVEEEWRVVWPDHSLHWLAGRWNVFKDAAGNPVRLMGVNIDITERKNLEQTLRDNTERLASIYKYG